jgi:Na+-driven multidrug efflux pump
MAEETPPELERSRRFAEFVVSLCVVIVILSASIIFAIFYQYAKKTGNVDDTLVLLYIFSVFLLILYSGVWLWMLVDCLKGNRTDKTAWVIVLLFLPLLGPLIYVFIAFKRPEHPG